MLFDKISMVSGMEPRSKIDLDEREYVRRQKIPKPSCAFFSVWQILKFTATRDTHVTSCWVS